MNPHSIINDFDKWFRYSRNRHFGPKYPLTQLFPGCWVCDVPFYWEAATY